MPTRLRDLFAAGLVAAAALLGSSPRAVRAQGPVPESWATTQAAELTRQAREHAARGEIEAAARRYLEAIGFDATYGPAYLGLGAVDEAKGDTREAERAYAMGIDHVVGFVEALVARGRLRARLRRFPEAIADLEAAAALRPDDLGIQRELVSAYVTAGALPAALATARRMTDAAARVRALALSILVGDVDPVAAGAAGRGPVRRALSQAARPRAAPRAPTSR